ncbi:MAG: alpha-ketoglutarate-dependent dioxygenase AlkB [Gammaproteobacteria bacterium]
MQANLFEPDPDSGGCIEHRLLDDPLTEYPNFYPAAEADLLLHTLLTEIPWRQESLRMAGKVMPIPRLQCWMGDAQRHYGYSGIRLKPQAWSDEVELIRSKIRQLTTIHYNSVLLNYYRDGRDSVAWHADDEPELGPAPVIAALSLGAERPFEFRPKPGYPGRKQRLQLRHGSLLIMGKTIQDKWMHQIPKVKGLNEPRVSLTFRQIQD